MDELLQQFLVESRELAEQASDDVLALEREPHDAQRFDHAFRAFHTLKGGAGIVDFVAMQTAVHAAESAFTAARAESRPLSADDIGNCLACLDQVVDWLDTIEATGALPPDADAASIVARLARPTELAPASAVATAGEAGDGWADALVRARPAAAAQARTALRYRPPADSFFAQQDPVARIAALQGLLALDIGPRTAWPPLDALDPFQCNLAITALLAVSPADVAAALGDEVRHCEVEPVAGGEHALPGVSLPAAASNCS